MYERRSAPTSEKVTFAADAVFDFDKSVVKPEGRAKLDELVGKIKGITLEVVIAVGHTDSIGSDAYNQRLSERRAEAVRQALVKEGLTAGAISTVGRGKTQPLVPTADGVREPQNRRAEIVLQ